MEIYKQVAIVTGASTGIGRATAKLLADMQASVVVAARSQYILVKTFGKMESVLVLPCDVTDFKQAKKLVDETKKRFGRIDILINNAGRGFFGLIEEINLEVYRTLWELNVMAPIKLMQMVIPEMKRRKRGVIVNISSGTALSFFPGVGGYSATKRALVGISLTAREELKGSGVSVGVVYPYITQTRFYENTYREKEPKWNIRSNLDGRPAADSAEAVAEKVVEAIKTEAAEVYLHDWMKPKA